MLREKIYFNIIAYNLKNFYIKFTKNDNSYGMLIGMLISGGQLVILPRFLCNILVRNCALRYFLLFFLSILVI